MKILLFGVRGQLGSVMYDELTRRGHEVKGLTHEDIDITDEAKVTDVILTGRPDAVVNCAAYNAVDKAESEEDICRRINTYAVGYMAGASEKVGAKFMHFSSDYVFDGRGNEPIAEDTQVHPLNIYGKSKADSEKLATSLCNRTYLVRVTWLYSTEGSNFVNTMLRLAETNRTIRVVNDQIGSPTYAPDLAQPLCDMLESDKYGIYNLTGSGYCSWYEFARRIFEIAGKDIEVIPITSREYRSAALRPQNSRLSVQKAVSEGFGPLPSWEESLKKMLIKR